MIVLGIIIAVLAAAAAVATVMGGVNHDAAVTLKVFGMHLPATSPAGVFLAGAATACIFLLGCSLVASGFRRSARVRRELRDLRDEHDENLQALVAEKQQLERQLARERHLGGTQTIQGRPLQGERAEPTLEVGRASQYQARTAPPSPAVFPGSVEPPGAISTQLHPRHGR